MENKFEHIDEVIARYLSGESTDDDRLLLQEWREQSDENNREYLQFEKLFNVSGELRDVLPVDTDAAWHKVQKSLAIPSEKGKVISLNSGSKRFSFLRIAAAILIFAGVGLSVYFMLFPGEQAMTQLASADSTRSVVLPDSSSIVLNRHSELAYSQDHFTKKRIVKLKGEALFNVVHDESNPFIVEAGNLKIQDVGTSFNVRAMENEDLIVVSVISGEVSLTTVSNETISLHQGEEARYQLSTHSFEKNEAVDPNVSAYSNRVFVFENAELSTVVQVLNEVYRNQLTIENASIESCRITVTFNDEPIGDIASVIALTLGVQVKQENNQFIFFGNGCK